jgi:hypothetical protein
MNQDRQFISKETAGPRQFRSPEVTMLTHSMHLNFLRQKNNFFFCSARYKARYETPE